MDSHQGNDEPLAEFARRVMAAIIVEPKRHRFAWLLAVVLLVAVIVLIVLVSTGSTDASMG